MLMQWVVARRTFLLAVHSSYSDSAPVRSTTDATLDGVPLQEKSARFSLVRDSLREIIYHKCIFDCDAIGVRPFEDEFINNVKLIH